MQSSINKNFVYRSALTLSTYIMGLITFPYISRVLGVEKLGLVNFVDNTINYFLHFATMGIGHIGIREIENHVTKVIYIENKMFSGDWRCSTFSPLSLVKYCRSHRYKSKYINELLTKLRG